MTIKTSNIVNMSTEVYCRLCGNLYPIHRVKSIEKLIAQKLDTIILKLLEIEISEHYFTKVVCMSCCYTIMNFHKYLEQVKTAQVKLIEISENQKNIVENDLKISSFASIVSEAVENEENGKLRFGNMEVTGTGAVASFERTSFEY